MFVYDFSTDNNQSYLTDVYIGYVSGVGIGVGVRKGVTVKERRKEDGAC